MALILDKTITGVTSVDESGNTLTTGLTNLTWIDSFGNIYDNPYMVVDFVTINKLTKFAQISISIYKDSESRKSLKKPVEERNQGCLSYEYDTYFSIPIMSDINIFKSAYSYIDDIYTGWKSDE